MKWKGTVSQVAKTNIATRLARAKTTHATSTHASADGQARRSSGVNAISLSASGGDDVGADLGPETSNAHVDHVRRWIEPEAPDGLQQLLLADRRPGMAHQLLEQQELPFGERDRSPSRVDLPAEHVETQPPRLEVSRQVAVGVAQPRVDPGEQFRERERFGQVVLGAELETVDLRPEVCK